MKDTIIKTSQDMPSELNVPELSISVIVPVYNNEGTLEELVSRLERVLSQLASDFRSSE